MPQGLPPPATFQCGHPAADRPPVVLNAVQLHEKLPSGLSIFDNATGAHQLSSSSCATRSAMRCLKDFHPPQPLSVGPPLPTGQRSSWMPCSCTRSCQVAASSTAAAACWASAAPFRSHALPRCEDALQARSLVSCSEIHRTDDCVLSLQVLRATPMRVCPVCMQS